MNTHTMAGKKYRPGYCLFCGDPIKKPGRLWCLATHRKKHDQRLKANPARYWDVICRTADDLEKAICEQNEKTQQQQKINNEQFKSMDRMVFKALYEEEKQKPVNEQDKVRMAVLKRCLK